MSISDSLARNHGLFRKELLAVSSNNERFPILYLTYKFLLSTCKADRSAISPVNNNSFGNLFLRVSMVKNLGPIETMMQMTILILDGTSDAAE
jgi:hypothetical protein